MRKKRQLNVIFNGHYYLIDKIKVNIYWKEDKIRFLGLTLKIFEKRYC